MATKGTVKEEIFAFLRINPEGSRLSFAAVATDDVASGGTSVAVSVPGAQAGDFALATINGGNSNAEQVISAAVTTDTVTVTLSGTPGATTPVSVLVLRVA